MRLIAWQKLTSKGKTEIIPLVFLNDDILFLHTSTVGDVLSGVTSTMYPDSSLHCAPRKCRAITEMLTERVVLRAAPTDRVLLGAKNLLLKYTLCSLAHYVGIQKSARIPYIDLFKKDGSTH